MLISTAAETSPTPESRAIIPYTPALDGVRGLAIFAVMVAHIATGAEGWTEAVR